MRPPEWNILLITRGGVGLEPSLIGGTYDWDIDRKVLSGGSFTTFTELPSTVGMSLDLSTTFDGSTYRHGRFIITRDMPNYSGPRTQRTLDFMDEAVIPSRMRLNEPYTLPRTTRATFAARDLLARNLIVASIHPSDRTLRVAMAWNPDEVVLDAANKLFDVCGFHPLWPSPRGLYTGPRVNPETAPVAHVFKEGEEALHLPDYPQEQDYLAVPNRLVATTNGDDVHRPLVAVARDVATSPWSFEARGYWVDADPYQSDLVTQDGLYKEAARKLKELQYNAITMTIQHMWTPDLTPGCVVEVEADNPDVAGRWQAVTSGTPLMGSDALVTTGLRKVRR